MSRNNTESVFIFCISYYFFKIYISLCAKNVFYTIINLFTPTPTFSSPIPQILLPKFHHTSLQISLLTLPSAYQFSKHTRYFFLGYFDYFYKPLYMPFCEKMGSGRRRRRRSIQLFLVWNC